MADTNKKLFAHRGFWTTEDEQNTIHAVLRAFEEGFDVEVDIRLNKEGELVTGHDTPQVFNWGEVLRHPDRKMIAFHVKEKGLAKKLWDEIGHNEYIEFIIFGVSEEEMELYVKLFGYESIAFEYNAGDDFEKVFNCKNKVIWIAELDNKRITKKEIILLKSMKKIVYMVTQDCHGGDMVLFGVRLNMYAEGLIDGICSDNADVIHSYVK